MSVHLPNSKQRITILGRTGSGKTQAGLWHLSISNFHEQPWVIVDFKTDEHINAIPYAEYIPVTEIPKKPGVYIWQPTIEELETLAESLEKIRVQENVGIWIDEGYMMGQNALLKKRFETLLTQGRSKHIPMIILSQRPVWISRFVFSESEFFQLFHLQDTRDVQTVESLLPRGAVRRLPKYHSTYFDVSRNKVTYLRPVPSESQILETLEKRLQPKRRKIVAI